eukprot:TRINITY_DN4818_c0_g1_i1.p1 TRINITY_DN4818_c0_g1~~TRINITY_DN4818_c0_g1_i1.p1  ORF type:complete len:466 (+),score=83.33 TRINITY_DN4818_c0_g1_i1:12-1409(+)
MSLHPDLSDQSLYAPFDEIKGCKTDTAWVLYGYVPRTDKIKVECTGTGNLADMMENMSEGKVHYGFIRYNLNGSFKFAYIAWCGEGVQGLRKGSFATHAVDMSKFLDGYHVQINARKEEDLDEATLLGRLKTAAASHGRRNLKAREQGTTGSDSPLPLPKPPTKDFSSGGFQGNLRSQSDSFWSDQRAHEQQTKASAPAQRQAPAPSGGGSVGRKWEQQQSNTAQQQQQPAKRAGPPPARVNTGAYSAPAPAPAPARSAPPPKVAAPTYQHHPPAQEESWGGDQQQQDEPAGQDSWGGDQQSTSSYEEPAAHDSWGGAGDQPEQDSWGGDQQSTSSYEEPAAHDSWGGAGDQPEQDSWGGDQQSTSSYEEPAAHDSWGGAAEPAQDSWGGGDQQSWSTSHDESSGQDTSIKCLALYTYEGENEGDLHFNEGDIITILDQSDPAGWWEGQLGSTTGFFPSNFVQQL